MDAWIDTYHAVRRLTRQGTFVFLTDSAVGAAEEDNLRHLVTNLGLDVPRERIVPFLTTKHCARVLPVVRGPRASERLSGAGRARRRQERSATPRSVEHAWQLRADAARVAITRLTLGGWANPHGDPERQVDFLAAPNAHAEFYLTQVVSHHMSTPVARFVDAAEQRGPDDAGAVRRLLLPQRQPAHARRAEGISAGAGRRADARVRWRRDAGRRLRAHDSDADGRRREALLHQQPAGAAGRSRCSRAFSRRQESEYDRGARVHEAGGCAHGQVPGCSRWRWRSRSRSTAQLQAQTQTPLQRLEASILRTTRSVNATWGIYVKSLETGEEIAIDADRQMETMSTIKIPLMIEVLRADQGAASSSSPTSTPSPRRTRSPAPARSSGSTTAPS